MLLFFGFFSNYDTSGTGSFGIGTFLTNDFRSISSEGKRSKALNMVIKLDSANGQHCVKISDDLSKVKT